jgi:hypothetical protein
MMQLTHKRIVLGCELDIDLRHAVRVVLHELGAVIRAHAQSTTRSRERHVLDVDVEGQGLRIEVETHEGVSVSGPASLTEHVSAIVTQRMRAITSRGEG